MTTESGIKNHAIFLNDAPCREDSAFQIHEEISQVIAREIIDESPDNVALVGGWGTGKSTVIERVESLLKKNFRSSGDANEKDSYIYFVFDAWAHSGDSLRRSFLDMLLAKINQKCDLDEDIVKGKRDEIYGKVSSSTIQESASFAPTVAAGIVAVAVYGVSGGLLRGALPLARNIAVMSGWLDANDYTGFSHWIDAISMLLAVLAFCLVKFAYRCSAAGRKRAQKRKCAKLSKDQARSEQKSRLSDRFCRSIAAIFSKKADATTTLVKQDNSPILDSVEFERLFQEILGLTDTTIIIVFDNLDRLNKAALREAWSTLQIFASSTDDRNAIKNRGNRPWILLPVSLEVFQAIENYAPKTETLSISKTFIRSFEIPVPIVSDWKGYFLKLARQAFPKADETILLNVYAIASHSLLRIESRTPRNAKRFINSMVSQSLVFPEISLVSIAAFCYAKDSYAIAAASAPIPSDNVPVNTFSDYMLSLISGITPESQYLGFPAGHIEGLDRDLAMMTYGQFSPEKASEVYVSLQMNRLFRGEDQVDFNRLVKNNFGAWELIAKEVEDALWGQRSSTPRWVFVVLAALHALDEEIQQADSEEINRLAQILIGGIRFLDDPGSQGCGVIVAECIGSCSSTVVEKLIDTLLRRMEDLVADIDQASEEDAIGKKKPALDALKKYLDEGIPVLEKGYQYNDATKSRLEKTLPSIDFGEVYGEFLNRAFSLSGDPKWIASRPPQTVDEFSQLFDMLATSVDVGDFQSPAINATNVDGLLDEFGLNDEELESLISALADSEDGLGSLEAKLWLLIKVCNLKAKIVEDLFNAVCSSVSELRSYAEEGDVHKRAAVLSVILNHYSDEEFTESDKTFIDGLCNIEITTFLKAHNTDLIPQVLKLLNSGENPLKDSCIKLLSLLWGPDDYAKRDREEFFALVAVKNGTDERKEQGRLFAKSGRVNELIEKEFNARWFSVYRGALEGLRDCKRDKEVFSDWLVGNMQAMSVKDWENVIQSNAAQSLIDVMSEIAKKVQLPQLDKMIGQEASGNPSKCSLKILIDLLDAYRSDLDYVANCITSRIIANQRQISMYVQNRGALLTCCKWLHSLTPEQRYFATEAIVKTRRTHDCEWLYGDLSAEAAPKLLYKGFLRKTKMLLGEQMGYKTMRKGAKEACGKILKLLE